MSILSVGLSPEKKLLASALARGQVLLVDDRMRLASSLALLSSGTPVISLNAERYEPKVPEIKELEEQMVVKAFEDYTPSMGRMRGKHKGRHAGAFGKSRR